MLLPFENDTRSFLKRYASKSLKRNRGRNIPILLTIIIAVVLITSFALIPISRIEAARNQVTDSYQALVADISIEELNSLEDNFGEENVGALVNFPSVESLDYKLFISYQDEDTMNLAKNRVTGEMPKSSDEILVRKNVIDYFKSDIGDSLHLDLGLGPRDYKVVGTVISEGFEIEETKNFWVIVSEDFVNDYNEFQQIEKSMRAYFRLPSVGELSLDEQKTEIERLCMSAGINDWRVHFNESHFYAFEPMNLFNTMVIIFIAICILFAAGMVINSVFYISIRNNVREYGRLRVIGASKKQIRSIIFRQGLVLGIAGGLIGVVISGIISYLSLPEGWNTMNYLVVGLMVLILSILMVIIALRKPGKIASTISPVEAVKYSVENDVEDTERESTHLNPMTMTKLNFMRNKKKTFMTVLSLSISGILLMIVGTFNDSISIEKMVRQGYNNYGDFFLYLSATDESETDAYAINKVQTHNPFDKELLSLIKGIDGVQDVVTHDSIQTHVTMPNGEISTAVLTGYDTSEEEFLKDYIIDGEMNYDELSKDDGIIVMVADVMKEAYKWEPKLGENLEFEYWTEDGIKKKSFVVEATMNERIKDGSYLVPNSLLQEMRSGNLITRVHIVAKEGMQESVEAELRNIVTGVKYIELTTISELMNMQSVTMSDAMTLVFIICIIVAVFGLISLANLIITNISSRAMELSMLRAVGMTKGQVRQMILYEGAAYSLAGILSTLILGTGAGVIMYFLVNKFSSTPYLDYTFPLGIAVIYILIVIVVQVLSSLYGLRKLEKGTLADRLKYDD